MTSSFLRESGIVPDLRSNPLMLGLMCNIYRGENYIPKNRPEVYRKCSETLFERWDRSRGIRAVLPFEALISPAMMFLGYWIYSEPSLRGGVAESQLVSKTTEYLLQRRYEDPDEAERAARGFIAFCKGRAWVFTDVGTTSNGESLYQFTHPTFLEYFAAFYLVRNYFAPDALLSVLYPRIAKREWDVVAQLSFQMLSSNIDQAADDLVAGLLGMLDGKKKDSHLNILSFAARSLEFIFPSPKIVRQLVQHCMNECFAQAREVLERLSSTARPAMHSKVRPAQLVTDLVGAASENRELVVSSLEREIGLRITGDDRIDAVNAVEMTLGMLTYVYIRSRYEITADDPLINLYQKLKIKIIEGHRDQIRNIAQIDGRIAVMAYEEFLITTEELVEWHGTKAVFYGSYPLIAPVSGPFSAAGMFVYSVFGRFIPEERAIVFEHTKDLGKILLSRPLPWVEASSLHLWPDWPWSFAFPFPEESSELPGYKPDRDLLFELYVVMAAMLELSVEVGHGKNSRIIRDELRRMSQHSNPFRVNLAFILQSRLLKRPQIRLEDQISECGFTSEQQMFLQKWAQKEIDFVSKPVASAKP